MLPWKRRCVPRLLRDRIPCDIEDFVGRYFPSGPRRDAARRLWRFIERFGINLSGLHPDDDLASLLGAAGLDRLDALELFAALRGELFMGPLVHDARLPTFRDCIDSMLRVPTSGRPQPMESRVRARVSARSQGSIQHRKATVSLVPRLRNPRRAKGLR
jgi:hypothetical protein